MSLNVNHLNADTTFLLTFTPPDAQETQPGKCSGSFTVLVDPWLEGHYTVWRSSFAIAYHTEAPSISSLADLRGVDLIVISQDKSDHCHEATLCSLPRDTGIRIAATPAAAKKIWSWKYFTNPNIVQIIPPYHAGKPETLIRIPIDARSPAASAGEITIANMPTKLDMANLHNAIGITYCPPGPLVTNISKENLDDPYSSGAESDMSKSMDASIVSDSHEKCLSVLYSPHGVSRSTVQPYVINHLTKLNGAFPLTALFHSLNVEANPWFMGGVVSAGAPGGAKLARALRAKYWIGAHDEMKDVSGMAIRFIRKEQFRPGEINDMLDCGNVEKNVQTELAILGCGEERRFEG